MPLLGEALLEEEGVGGIGLGEALHLRVEGFDALILLGDDSVEVGDPGILHAPLQVDLLLLVDDDGVESGAEVHQFVAELGKVGVPDLVVHQSAEEEGAQHDDAEHCEDERDRNVEAGEAGEVVVARAAADGDSVARGVGGGGGQERDDDGGLHETTVVLKQIILSIKNRLSRPFFFQFFSSFFAPIIR